MLCETRTMLGQRCLKAFNHEIHQKQERCDSVFVWFVYFVVSIISMYVYIQGFAFV
jgi:hypothetical protein